MSDLDFKVKSITDILDIKFRGTTDAEKRAFVDKYFPERQKVVAEMLGESFREMVGAQNE